MPANRQAAKQSESFKSWRYIAAFCAIVFGAVLSFSFVVQHIFYRLSFRHDFRSFETVLALSAGIAAYRGSSARFVLLVFGVISLLNPDNIWFASDMVTGRFQYATGMSVHSVLLFLSTVLPYAGIVAAVIADPLTYRAFMVVRRWPDTERA